MKKSEYNQTIPTIPSYCNATFRVIPARPPVRHRSPLAPRPLETNLPNITPHRRTLVFRDKSAAKPAQTSPKPGPTTENKTMQKVRNITVAASPEPCRQTRRLATGCSATVTDGFRFPLLVQPDAVNQARIAGGRPRFAAARSRRDQAAKMSAYTPPNSPQKPQNELQKPVCIPVKPN
jgi:hypothetical protein